MAYPVSEWLAGQGLAVKPEFRMPWGICDLVGVALDEGHAAIRLQHGQRKAIGPLSRVALLLKLPNVDSGRSATFAGLKSRLKHWMNEEQLLRSLQQLHTDHFVHSPRSGCFQRLDGWWPLERRLVTVELKLSRVRDAIFQAACYTSIAHESYVAFPMETAERLLAAGPLREVREAGVGVLGVDIHRCSVLLSPVQQGRTRDEIVRTHAVESFWREHVKGS